MHDLDPAHPELVAHYRRNVAEYSRLADGESIPRFTVGLMNRLTVFLGSSENAKLVEAVARLDNYGDEAFHAALDKAVRKRMRKEGHRYPRGKRNNAALEELINSLTPLLIFFGVPLSSGENSRLIWSLRNIADEFGVKGDPRGTLRRKIKNKRDYERLLPELNAQLNARAYHAIMQAAANAWRRPDELHKRPNWQPSANQSKPEW